MAEYISSDVKVIGIGDSIGIDIPEPIASISFDAFSAGTYMVDVQQNGSYSATFVGTMHEVKQHDENNNCR